MAAPASPLSRSAFAFVSWALALTIALAASAHAAPKWGPINKAELAETTPKIDPEAGAEILEWKAYYDFSSYDDGKMQYSFRVKVFNQQGATEFTKIELSPPSSRQEISDIAARTIKADGTSVELNPKDIYEREVIKFGNAAIKTKSFAPPAVEPGVIIEYKYSVSCPYGWLLLGRLFFQDKYPVRKVQYTVRPPGGGFDQDMPQFTARALHYNCLEKPLKLGKDNCFYFEMADLPAAKDEPFQPPEVNSKISILLYWTAEKNSSAKEYWPDLSRRLYKMTETEAKPTSEIKSALAGIISAGDSEQEKVAKIYDYCRTTITNQDRGASGLTPKQRKKITKNDDTTDTLKAHSGTSNNINAVFAALVRAADVEAQFAICNDRSELFFNPRLTFEPVSMPQRVVAVRIGLDWTYFDPGATYLPFGVLRWQNTDTAILMADSAGLSKPQPVPGSPADATVCTRKATLNLNPDGTLEGDVTEEYTGQQGADLKDSLDGKSVSESETYIRDAFHERQKAAELTSIKVENATSPILPLKISYHLRIAGYAEITGTRLFVQPALFQRGAPSLFEASTRRSDIIFHYRSRTTDEITFQPPAGYSLEQASAPHNIDLGQLGSYEADIRVGMKTGKITYKRNFEQAGLKIPATSYTKIKQAYDMIAKEDGHTLTLIKKGDAADTVPSTVPQVPAAPAQAPASSVESKEAGA